MDLKKQVIALRDSSLADTVDKKLEEFTSLGGKGNREWFSELCFCILTANSKARTAIEIQNELGYVGFSTFSKDCLSESIRRNKHRFHNNKSTFIILARDYLEIKSILADEPDPENGLSSISKVLLGKRAVIS